MKPTIGILGGCGPLATLDIEQKILKAMQRLLHPLIDQDYFNMLVLNHTQFCDRNDVIIFNKKALFDEYLQAMKSLVSLGADVLLLACQTAHHYLPELQKFISVPIVDIVQEMAKFMSKSFSTDCKIGLLATEATNEKKLYQTALAPYGIEVVSPSAEIQKKLMEAIYIIKTGVHLSDEYPELPNLCHLRIDQSRYSEFKQHPYRQVLVEKTFPNPHETIKQATAYLAGKGCRQVILGCTELPLILPHIQNIEKIKVGLIDPNSIVAESIVCLAAALEKK